MVYPNLISVHVGMSLQFQCGYLSKSYCTSDDKDRTTCMYMYMGSVMDALKSNRVNVTVKIQTCGYDWLYVILHSGCVATL